MVERTMENHAENQGGATETVTSYPPTFVQHRFFRWLETGFHLPRNGGREREKDSGWAIPPGIAVAAEPEGEDPRKRLLLNARGEKEEVSTGRVDRKLGWWPPFVGLWASTDPRKTEASNSVRWVTLVSAGPFLLW